MEYKYLLKNEGFKKLMFKFNKLDFNIESNVKYFLEKINCFIFNNKCFVKKLSKFSTKNLNKKDKCKILKNLKPFINFINIQNENNFNKFNEYIKKDPEFQKKTDFLKLRVDRQKKIMII